MNIAQLTKKILTLDIITSTLKNKMMSNTDWG